MPWAMGGMEVVDVQRRVRRARAREKRCEKGQEDTVGILSLGMAPARCHLLRAGDCYPALVAGREWRMKADLDNADKTGRSSAPPPEPSARPRASSSGKSLCLSTSSLGCAPYPCVLVTPASWKVPGAQAHTQLRPSKAQGRQGTIGRGHCRVEGAA